MLVLLGALAGLLVDYTSVRPLIARGPSSWWTAHDAAHARTTHSGGRLETVVRIRSGTTQGFVVTLHNRSGWSQTVLGPAKGFVSPGGPEVTTAVSTGAPTPSAAGVRALSYVADGTIPPHGSRAVRVLWHSTACLSARTTEGIDQLSLKVRIGWFTRTELVTLPEAWYLAGPSNAHCG